MSLKIGDKSYFPAFQAGQKGETLLAKSDLSTYSIDEATGLLFQDNLKTPEDIRKALRRKKVPESRINGILRILKNNVEVEVGALARHLIHAKVKTGRILQHEFKFINNIQILQTIGVLNAILRKVGSDRRIFAEMGNVLGVLYGEAQEPFPNVFVFVQERTSNFGNMFGKSQILATAVMIRREKIKTRTIDQILSSEDIYQSNENLFTLALENLSEANADELTDFYVKFIVQHEIKHHYCPFGGSMFLLGAEISTDFSVIQALSSGQVTSEAQKILYVKALATKVKRKGDEFEFKLFNSCRENGKINFNKLNQISGKTLESIQARLKPVVSEIKKAVKEKMGERFEALYQKTQAEIATELNGFEKNKNFSSGSEASLWSQLLQKAQEDGDPIFKNKIEKLDRQLWESCWDDFEKIILSVP